MTDSRPLSPSPGYSAESDDATSQSESHGAAQHASLHLVLRSDISDTSEANPSSSYTSSAQSPPPLADQAVGDLGHDSRPLAAISATDRGFTRGMRAGTGQAAVALPTTCSTHVNACRLVAPPAADALAKSGVAGNAKADKPTTTLSKEISPSSGIVWVECPAADRRKRSQSSTLDLDSLPNEVAATSDVVDALSSTPIRVLRGSKDSHIFLPVYLLALLRARKLCDLEDALDCCVTIRYMMFTHVGARYDSPGLD
ncbi:hypothetical protein PG984_013042 [Apiospora sp. TS-2023a]